jgi:predicted metal-dependent phosphoesterase TrpH
MIDLHIHTISSDGTDTVSNILKKANKLNIEALSITDHNSLAAYLELESIDSWK